MQTIESANIKKGKRKIYYHAKPIYKYAVFAGETFYPAGGFEDFYGYASNYEEALQICKEAITIGSRPRRSWWCDDNETIERGRCDWSHVVNLKKQKIVYSTTADWNDYENESS